MSLLRYVILASCLCASTGAAWAYAPGGRWSGTASNLTTGGVGNSATLTWSIAPDGTWITKEQAGSNLISTFDATWGAGPGGSDLTQRPWFTLVEQSFQRWGQLGGVDFRYEPHDDGAPLNDTPATLGVRGDIRLTGTHLDGPLNRLAYNETPGDGGDTVLDTSDMGYFGNSTNNYRRFRNNLMHEIGHGLGLNHIRSSDSNFLMESAANISYDGPQMDDILGLHHLYGDIIEQLNDGAGDDVLSRATSLGTFEAGDARTYGAASLVGPAVDESALAFLSISNQSDKDFFSFTITKPQSIDLLLLPGGASYQYNNLDQWDTTAISNLKLEVFDASGATIATIDGAGLGQVERQRNLLLTQPGEYFLGVSGNHYLAQFYALHIAANTPTAGNPMGDYNHDGIVDLADVTVWRDLLGTEGLFLAADGSQNGVVSEFDRTLWQNNYGAGLVSALPGDFNTDGTVDLQDFTLWRDSVGQVGFDVPGDANRDYRVDQDDYDIWLANFGRVWGGAGQLSLATIPEPSGASLLMLAAACLAFRRLHSGRDYTS